MSKAINLSGLKTLLEPLIHLIDKKAERPDWNENDPRSSSYIAGRTHYKEVEEQTISASFTIADGQPVTDPFTISLVAGESYAIEWDGVKYNCVAYIAEGPNSPSIGNGTIANVSGGNGEPFFITAYGNQVMVFGENGDHTFYYSALVEVVHKIDEKYLPHLIGADGSGVNGEIFNDYENNEASGGASHAEGVGTTASGLASHAEGYETSATHQFAHAEGENTVASRSGAHAEGSYTTASGYNSHAEGQRTEASGECSHAEGLYATASGQASHAEGYYTTAKGYYQHVQGISNIPDTTSVHIVGNGLSGVQSNAHTLDWDGNAWYAGDVYVGSTSGTNKDDGSKKLATEEYVTTLVGETPVSEQITTALEGYVKLDPNDTTISGEAALVNAGTFNGLTYDAVKSDIASAATSGMTFNSTGVNMFVGTKAIEGEITSAFRTQTKGNTTGDHYLSVVRAESGLTNVPVYGSGLAWGRWDTHGYLMTDYNTAKAYIGGGSADTLRWCKQIAFTDHTHTYSDVGAAAASHTHGQVDWGDNSTSSSTYIKNRTHYKSLSSTPYSSDTVTVTPTSQTLSFAAPSNNYAVVVECDGGISWSSSYSSRYGSYYNVYISSTDGQNHTATIKLYEYVYTKLDNRYLNSSVHTDDNLSFSLSGTTLTITKS